MAGGQYSVPWLDHDGHFDDRNDLSWVIEIGVEGSRIRGDRISLDEAQRLTGTKVS